MKTDKALNISETTLKKMAQLRMYECVGSKSHAEKTMMQFQNKFDDGIYKSYVVASQNHTPKLIIQIKCTAANDDWYI